MKKNKFAISLLLAILLVPGEAFTQDGPRTTRAIVEQAAAAGAAIPPGPFAPTWDSLRTNYSTPGWFRDAKFGIFMHWGLYAVPAHGSEWYEKHLYGNPGITR